MGVHIWSVTFPIILWGGEEGPFDNHTLGVWLLSLSIELSSWYQLISSCRGKDTSLSYHEDPWSQGLMYARSKARHIRSRVFFFVTEDCFETDHGCFGRWAFSFFFPSRFPSKSMYPGSTNDGKKYLLSWIRNCERRGNFKVKFSHLFLVTQNEFAMILQKKNKIKPH